MSHFHTAAGLRFADSIQYPEIDIAKNSFTFITGKSGCGKSTYLKFLNRSIPDKQGRVFFQQRLVSEYEILSYRKQVLLVPQSVYLTSGSIADNFRFYYENRQQEPLSVEEIKKYLSLCCIEANPETLCETMSGGERHRVFLAIFLSLAQDTFLLDEPTAALDEKTADQFMHNLKNYCKQHKLTAICVCHSRKLVEKYADSVIDLEVLTHE